MYQPGAACDRPYVKFSGILLFYRLDLHIKLPRRRQAGSPKRAWVCLVLQLRDKQTVYISSIDDATIIMPQNHN
jgi:hypothetical protein